jgi:hypothetical protein
MPDYPFNIYAHQHRVEDIPKALMKAIRETMTDSSYGNDESASFLIEESLISKKAIRLWVDHLEVAKRCDEEQFRFLLVSFSVNKGTEGYDKEDCANYSNDDFYTFFVCNEYEELAAELSMHIPRFKESYELFLANEEALK